MLIRGWQVVNLLRALDRWAWLVWYSIFQTRNYVDSGPQEWAKQNTSLRLFVNLFIQRESGGIMYTICPDNLNERKWSPATDLPYPDFK